MRFISYDAHMTDMSQCINNQFHAIIAKETKQEVWIEIALENIYDQKQNIANYDHSQKENNTRSSQSNTVKLWYLEHCYLEYHGYVEVLRKSHNLF